jgi:holo-ACP synthase/triphosphoribosyl-dephospho-CoA synthase
VRSETVSSEKWENLTKVSLEQVLAFREYKARRQGELLAEYGLPLISLGLNMPGEYKRFPLAERSFREEIKILQLTLKAEGVKIVHEENIDDPGGYGAIISADAEAEFLKEIARRIEEEHPLGRLFDIDVLRKDGEKISRRDKGGPARPCLICGGDAFVCGRSRAHNVEDLQNATAAIMLNFQREELADITAKAALRALVGEVAVTPKPGLVDRANNGAHRDMDFFSFIDSTAAVLPYFRSCALAGYDFAEDTPGKLKDLEISQPCHPAALFRSLRRGGKIAEQEMLQAARGVNTHRGIIFSFGIISAAFGVFFRHTEQPAAEDILAFAAVMCCRVGEDFSIKKESVSHGEDIQKRFGMGGIREEAAGGFPCVRDYGLPLLRQAFAEGCGPDEAGLGAFLNILAVTNDTNIVYRGSPDTLRHIQKETKDFLATDPDAKAMREYALKLDREFISKNISPGGCADLLALSFFLCYLAD